MTSAEVTTRQLSVEELAWDDMSFTIVKSTKFEYNQQKVKVSCLNETGKIDYPLIDKSMIHNGKNIKSEQQ